ncbi:MAG: phosphonate C-P lyase system protein PhnH [Rhodospirillales bacterium]|nr:phosphonate C-P lyase system protein PhnH [Rhodospirillales bacterium]
MTDLLSDPVAMPGFADPVADAQHSFRAVLAAMASPGSLHHVGAGLTAPAPLVQASAAMLLTLADAETPVFLDGDFAGARSWIAFHCAAPLVDSAGAARFALTRQAVWPADLALGSDEAPEESATLIVQLAALGSGTRYRLHGPGLAAPTPFAATGLPDGFVAAWARNRQLYPRGIDLILCAGTQIAALPRSVSVEEI